MKQNIIIKIEAFIYVLRKNLKVGNKISDMLDRYNKLFYNYQSKIGYDCLIQNIIPRELIKIMGAAITDLDI